MLHYKLSTGRHDGARGIHLASDPVFGDSDLSDAPPSPMKSVLASIASKSTPNTVNQSRKSGNKSKSDIQLSPCQSRAKMLSVIEESQPEAEETEPAVIITACL